MKNMQKQLNNMWKNKLILTLVAIMLFAGAEYALASAPSVTTNGASVSYGNAKINGSVSSQDISPVKMWFEWGTSSSLGNSTSVETRWHSGDFNIGRVLGDLNANTTYYYRAAAQDGGGKTYGETMSFSTAANNNTSGSSNGSSGSNSNTTYNSNGITTTGKTPIVGTTYATNVTVNGVSLNGYIDPNGSTDTSRWFEWGTTQALGNISGYASAGTNPHYFSHGITGLERNTTYYFRAVGRTNAGTVNGSIFSFTTGSSNTATSNVEPIIMVREPSYVSANDAQLSATAIKGGSTLTSGYFEWGASPALLNNSTQSQAFSGAASVNMYASLQNLKADTSYSFRAVVQDGTSAIHRSQIITFRTPARAVVSGVTNDAAGGTSDEIKNAAATTDKKNAPQTSGKNTVTANVLSANTSIAMIGWFLAIILLIIVLILIVMLRRCGKKNTNESNSGEYKEFPETVSHPMK